MLRKLYVMTTALAGVSVLASAPVHADAAYPEKVNDEIVVQGRYLSLDKLNAVKAPVAVIDVPQSLSIVTDAQIRDQGFTSLADVWRYTPGLSPSQGEGNRDAINIRGNQSTADFFIDGLRDDVQYYRPLYNIEQVEILRGSNALIFGRGGGGGVINRVAKTPNIGEQFTALTGSVDTFGAYSGAVDSNFEISETSAARVNAFFEGLNNHRDFYDGERFAINPTFQTYVTPDTSVLLSYEYLDDDRTTDRGIPSVSVNNGPDEPLSGARDVFFGSPDENRTTLQAHILRARAEHQFSDTLRGNITAQFADYDKMYQNLYAAGFDAASNEVTLDGYNDTTDRQNLIIQGNMISEFETGPFTHTLLFGGEYGDQDSANARRDNVFAVNGDDQIAIPVTDPLQIPDFAFTSLSRDRNSSVKFASLYIQDQIDVIDNLKLVVGGRYDRFDIDVLDNVEAGDADANDGQFSRVDEELSPRLGLIYKPAQNVSLYASYSETFLPRSGDQFLTLDLDSQDLDPQFFQNREIGFKWDIRPDISLTTAFFRLEQDQVTTVQPSDPSQILILDGTQIDGMEIQLAGEITENLYISAGYSYLDGDVRGGGFDGNVTRQTPKNMISLWSRYQASEKLGFGLGVTHQSEMFVREDNAVEVPGFTRVDAAIYYDPSDDLRLQVNVENALDETYFPSAHSNDNISTGKPLNAKFTVSKRF